MRIDKFDKHFNPILCTIYCVCFSMLALIFACIFLRHTFIGLFVSFVPIVLSLTLILTYSDIRYRILTNTIEEDRRTLEPEIIYEYGVFDKNYWTFVKKRTRYGVYDKWQEEYNLINKKGEVFLEEWAQTMTSQSIRDGQLYQITDKNSLTNLILCSGYSNRDCVLIFDEPVQKVGQIDSEGYIQVTFTDGSVNYITLQGDVMFEKNLIGKPR